MVFAFKFGFLNKFKKTKEKSTDSDEKYDESKD